MQYVHMPQATEIVLSAPKVPQVPQLQEITRSQNTRAHKWFYKVYYLICPALGGCTLDYSNLVGYIQRIIVWSKTDISLLLTIGPDQCVHLGHINIIQLLDSLFDLMFVGLDIYNEDQGVVILYLLHGGLCGQRELDNGIVVKLVPPRSTLPRIFGLSP